MKPFWKSAIMYFLFGKYFQPLEEKGIKLNSSKLWINITSNWGQYKNEKLFV